MTDLSIHLDLVDGEPMADSRDIAARFRKNHRDVLRAIDEHVAEIAALEGAAQNCAAPIFKQEQALDTKGRPNGRLYLLNRAAFSLVVMSFTGSGALRWKLAYIDAFERMEAEIERLRGGEAILPVVEKMIAEALAEQERRFIEREKALVERVSVAAVEKAVMHEQGDFIRYVSAKSVCLMAGVDPKGLRGMTNRVSRALIHAGVPYRFDFEAESGPRYKFEPTVAREWATSPAGRAFIEAAAAAARSARTGKIRIVEFQPRLPNMDEKE